MISIVDKSKNITVSFDGNIKRTPSLRGYVVTETALGVEKSESTRGVINMTINITHLSIEDYNSLELLFLTSSTFEVVNSNKGTHYLDYYISGDVLDLTENEDLRNNTYYYNGSIEIKAR